MASGTENKVIAHYLDGTLLKGTTRDFYPRKAKFRVETANGDTQVVHVEELKALFFVRNFEGRPEYRERKGFFLRRSKGKKVMVEFFDGEVIFGFTSSYSEKGYGFFMRPGDPDSNNMKIFVVRSSTKRVKIQDQPKVAAS